MLFPNKQNQNTLTMRFILFFLIIKKPEDFFAKCPPYFQRRTFFLKLTKRRAIKRKEFFKLAKRSATTAMCFLSHAKRRHTAQHGFPII